MPSSNRAHTTALGNRDSTSGAPQGLTKRHLPSPSTGFTSLSHSDIELPLSRRSTTPSVVSCETPHHRASPCPTLSLTIEAQTIAESLQQAAETRRARLAATATDTSMEPMKRVRKMFDVGSALMAELEEQLRDTRARLLALEEEKDRVGEEREALVECTHMELGRQLAEAGEQVQILREENSRLTRERDGFRSEAERATEEYGKAMDNLCNTNLAMTSAQAAADGEKRQMDQLVAKLKEARAEVHRVSTEAAATQSELLCSAQALEMEKQSMAFRLDVQEDLTAMWHFIASHSSHAGAQAIGALSGRVEVGEVRLQLVQMLESQERDARSAEAANGFLRIVSAMLSDRERCYRIVKGREVAAAHVSRCRRPPGRDHAGRESPASHFFSSSPAPRTARRDRSASGRFSATPDRESLRASPTPRMTGLAWPPAPSGNTSPTHSLCSTILPQEEPVEALSERHIRIMQLVHEENSARTTICLASRISFQTISDMESHRFCFLALSKEESEARHSVAMDRIHGLEQIKKEVEQNWMIVSHNISEQHRLAATVEDGEVLARQNLAELQEHCFDSLAHWKQEEWSRVRQLEVDDEMDRLIATERDRRKHLAASAEQYMVTLVAGVSCVALLGHREPAARYAIRSEQRRRREDIVNSFRQKLPQLSSISWARQHMQLLAAEYGRHTLLRQCLSDRGDLLRMESSEWRCVAEQCSRKITSQERTGLEYEQESKRGALCNWEACAFGRIAESEIFDRQTAFIQWERSERGHMEGSMLTNLHSLFSLSMRQSSLWSLYSAGRVGYLSQESAAFRKVKDLWGSSSLSANVAQKESVARRGIHAQEEESLRGVRATYRLFFLQNFTEPAQRSEIEGAEQRQSDLMIHGCNTILKMLGNMKRAGMSRAAAPAQPPLLRKELPQVVPQSQGKPVTGLVKALEEFSASFTSSPEPAPEPVTETASQATALEQMLEERMSNFNAMEQRRSPYLRRSKSPLIAPIEPDHGRAGGVHEWGDSTCLNFPPDEGHRLCHERGSGRNKAGFELSPSAESGCEREQSAVLCAGPRREFSPSSGLSAVPLADPSSHRSGWVAGHQEQQEIEAAECTGREECWRAQVVCWRNLLASFRDSLLGENPSGPAM